MIGFMLLDQTESLYRLRENMEWWQVTIFTLHHSP